MTQDDIIRMAREAGFRIDPEGEVLEGDGWHIQTDIVERFAALVAAAEREAVANIVEQMGIEGYGTLAIAVAIRARRQE